MIRLDEVSRGETHECVMCEYEALVSGTSVRLQALPSWRLLAFQSLAKQSVLCFLPLLIPLLLTSFSSFTDTFLNRIELYWPTLNYSSICLLLCFILATTTEQFLQQ